MVSWCLSETKTSTSDQNERRLMDMANGCSAQQDFCIASGGFQRRFA